jgi:hypothetical protein
MSNATLTESETLVLNALRFYQEGEQTFKSGVYGSVYLDNARPVGMSARSFAGVLSSLERKGLYKSQGDDCFGYVKMPEADQPSE